MPKVRIMPNSTFQPGHVNSLLAQVAPGPVALEKDGSVTVKLTDDQLENFYRRGGAAHKVEILPESDPHSAVASTEPAAERETVMETTAPVTQAQTQAVHGVEGYIAHCLARGMAESEIVHQLVSAGWKESQAIDAVFNRDPNPPAA